MSPKLKKRVMIYLLNILNTLFGSFVKTVKFGVKVSVFVITFFNLLIKLVLSYEIERVRFIQTNKDCILNKYSYMSFMRKAY